MFWWHTRVSVNNLSVDDEEVTKPIDLKALKEKGKDQLVFIMTEARRPCRIQREH